MSYFVQNDLIGLVPDEWLVGATTDEAGDQEDVFAAVHAAAKTLIDGAVGSRFPLPLDLSNEALAAEVKGIGIWLAVEALYTRRAVPVPKDTAVYNAIKEAREILMNIRNGSHPLAAVKRASDSIAIIGEDSRIYSTNIAA